MIILPRALACLLAVILSANAVLRAQPEPDKTVPRTFRVMSIVGSYRDLFYQTSPAKSSIRPVTITRSLSASLPVPIGTTLEIFRWVPPPPDAPPGTPPTRQIALAATLAPDALESIVIGRPLTPENKKTNFRAKVISLGEDYHAGTCLMANMSGFSAAAVSIQDKVHTLKDDAVEMTTFEKGHTLIKVAVTMQQGNSAWSLAGDDAWRLNGMYRGYIIILPYMDDPDYPPPIDPPPALVRINFAISPEIIRQRNSAPR